MFAEPFLIKRQYTAVSTDLDADLDLELILTDGQTLTPGEPIACLRGSVRDLLTSERTILNIVGRLCGIASLTASILYTSPSPRDNRVSGIRRY